MCKVYAIVYCVCNCVQGVRTKNRLCKNKRCVRTKDSMCVQLCVLCIRGFGGRRRFGGGCCEWECVHLCVVCVV